MILEDEKVKHNFVNEIKLPDDILITVEDINKNANMSASYD